MKHETKARGLYYADVAKILLYHVCLNTYIVTWADNR